MITIVINCIAVNMAVNVTVTRLMYFCQACGLLHLVSAGSAGSTYEAVGLFLCVLV